MNGRTKFLVENRTRRPETWYIPLVFLNDFSVGVMRSEELHVGGLTDVSDAKAEEGNQKHEFSGCVLEFQRKYGGGVL